jgi:hypothetical protein
VTQQRVTQQPHLQRGKGKSTRLHVCWGLVDYLSWESRLASKYRNIVAFLPHYGQTLCLGPLLPLVPVRTEVFEDRWRVQRHQADIAVPDIAVHAAVSETRSLEVPISTAEGER